MSRAKIEEALTDAGAEWNRRLSRCAACGRVDPDQAGWTRSDSLVEHLARAVEAALSTREAEPPGMSMVRAAVVVAENRHRRFIEGIAMGRCENIEHPGLVSCGCAVCSARRYVGWMKGSAHAGPRLVPVKDADGVCQACNGLGVLSGEDESGSGVERDCTECAGQGVHKFTVERPTSAHVDEPEPEPEPEEYWDRSRRGKCFNCGKLATCVGRYEGHGPIAFACDECCGHGNEDGWCHRVEPGVCGNAGEPEGAVERAWLIERDNGLCFGVKQSHGAYRLCWVTPDEALRFARKEDAEAFILRERIGNVEAQEHSWWEPTEPENEQKDVQS